MCLDCSVAPSLGVDSGDTDMATVVDISNKPPTVYVLETIHRETGKVQRQVFVTPEDRMDSFELDLHTYSYRLEEKGEA